MARTTRARFEVDDDYDIDQASDGVSRFGHYLRKDLESFLEWAELEDGRIDTSSNKWLEWTFARATSPIMVPGYARVPAGVLEVSVGTDQWDGALMASLEVAGARPRGLPWRWQGWEQSAAGWPEEPRRLPMALTTVTLAAQLVPDDGPRRTISAEFGDGLVRAAQDSVRSLCARLNETFGDALDEIRSDAG